MPYLPSLPEGAILADLFKAFPEIPRAKLSDFTQAVMQGPSPFTEGERELIGAYTSGLNGCRHCYRGHVLAAAEWGIDEDLFEKLLDDVDTAPVDARMKPVLRYVRKLTETPSRPRPERRRRALRGRLGRARPLLRGGRLCLLQLHQPHGRRHRADGERGSVPRRRQAAARRRLRALGGRRSTLSAASRLGAWS